MAAIKKTLVSSEVSEKESEEEFEEEFEEMEEAPEDEEYEDIEEEAYEEEEEDEVVEEEETRKVNKRKCQVEEIGKENEGADELGEEAKELEDLEEKVKEQEEEGVEDAVEEAEELEEVEEKEMEELEGVNVKEEEKEMVDVHEVKKEEESIEEPGQEEEKLSMHERSSASDGIRFSPVVAFPPSFQSMNDLEKFHAALSKFLYQWKSLNRSFESINVAINALSQHAVPSIKQEKGELQIMYESMDGKALRSYIEHNLFRSARLRCEVIEALRCHPCPGKLVIEAIGNFPTQEISGSPCRRSIIFLLELFLLSGRTIEDTSLKEEAEAAAHAWMRRLTRGVIENAKPHDTFCFILFLACCGIPHEFCLVDLGRLLQRINLNKKGDLFRSSNILFEKIPGIIKELIREEMYVEAANISCGFGLNETFPPLPLLSSFVTKAVEVGKKEAKESAHCMKKLRESRMKQLVALKSVAKCLEDHSLDPCELACACIKARVTLHDKISKLEKWIAKQDERLKRKAEQCKAYNAAQNQSKKARRSSSEVLGDEEEQGFPAHPRLPDSRPDNSSIPAAFSNTAEHLYGRDRPYYGNSAGYRALDVEYPAAQNFYHPMAPAYENEVRSSGRNLYC